MPKSAPIKSGDHTLEIDPIVDFGYLTIETDGKTLTATFKTSDEKGVTERDSVTVDIKAGKIDKVPSPGGNGEAPDHTKKHHKKKTKK
jgi:hypothetical protein